MSNGAWTVVGLAAILSVTAIVALLLRRRAKAGGSSAKAGGSSPAQQAARRAIRQSARDQRRRNRGSIRGEGYGGDDNQGYNAGVASDSGGMP
jgi:hypothetical protein